MYPSLVPYVVHVRSGGHHHMWGAGARGGDSFWCEEPRGLVAKANHYIAAVVAAFYSASSFVVAVVAVYIRN